jgi:hypothetical protein
MANEAVVEVQAASLIIKKHDLTAFFLKKLILPSLTVPKSCISNKGFLVLRGILALIVDYSFKDCYYPRDV